MNYYNTLSYVYIFYKNYLSKNQKYALLQKTVCQKILTTISEIHFLFLTIITIE